MEAAMTVVANPGGWCLESFSPPSARRPRTQYSLCVGVLGALCGERLLPGEETERDE
jgi:hypothetical protein